jgi:class 3 adenylate cyclase
MQPRVRFCRSADGTRVTYTGLGSGSPLVMMLGWSTGFEAEWRDPDGRDWHQRIAADHHVLRCERRGYGSHGDEPASLALEAQAGDLLAVIDDADLDRTDLFGAYDGAVVAATFAALYPERVGRLVLWSPFARGGDVAPNDAFDLLGELWQRNWQLARRTWTGQVFPSGTPERLRWYNDLLREWYTGILAARWMQFVRDVDITDMLARVRAPALVLAREGDRVVPPSATRAVAALLVDATFVSLPGDEAYPPFGDVSYLADVAAFLRGQSQSEPISTEARSTGAFRTVVFTDLVGHTEMMRRLGDDRGRKVLREHERITRDLLQQHGGAEVKTMGDGFMASFASVTKAMDCAIALQRAFAAHQGEPLQVRVGLNAGEPIEEDGDLFGSTVIMASRIAAQAGAGEILIPEPLRHLLTGKSYVYSDRGETMLKGFEDAVRLYEVRWRE